ncbi:hypothetical protein ACFFP0_12710 [Rhizobium puerariae]|uniref:Uncharacterized protein n=1 Tax=Rhizobium puerariae TaxID=1585791 RepID=A0ABV6AK60_9HYPH
MTIQFSNHMAEVVATRRYLHRHVELDLLKFNDALPIGTSFWVELAEAYLPLE